MKTWIKRVLIGSLGASVLLGGLAACAGHGPWGSSASEADRAQWRGRVIERVAGKLDLDGPQRAKLQILSDTLAAQHKAVVGTTSLPEEAQALIAGRQFDRVKAQALIDERTQALKEASPAVIAAFSDFFDSLRPEQQQKVREVLSKGRPGHGWRG